MTRATDTTNTSKTSTKAASRRNGPSNSATGSRKSNSGNRKTNSIKDNDEDNNQDDSSYAEQLSYSEAQTALELALAQLQAPDLPVEEMGALYQRAQAYATRCQQLLEEIEQSIDLWDPQSGQVMPFENA